MTTLRLLCALAVCALVLSPSSASAQITLDDDREAFTADVDALDEALTDDFESCALADIALGEPTVSLPMRTRARLPREVQPVTIPWIPPEIGRTRRENSSRLSGRL